MGYELESLKEDHKRENQLLVLDCDDGNGGVRVTGTIKLMPPHHLCFA